MEYLETSVLISGGEFPYIRFGRGEKNLVIITGITMTSLTGLGQPVSMMYRDYTDEYTIYVFDRLQILPDDASIKSMAQDTAEAMKALGIKKADVMGASQGAMIALVLAIDHPELVHAVIPCSSCSYPNEVANETFSVWASLADKADGNGIYKDFFERVYTCPNEAALALCLDTSTAEQCRRFGIQVRACSNFDCRDELKKIQCPVFVLGAAQDKVLGGESSLDLAKRLNCEFFIYPNYGHAVYDEAPDFLERMFDFLHKVK